MTAILNRILEAKRGEVARMRSQKLPVAPPLRPVSLKRSPGGGLHLIAEIKFRSPSAGPLSKKLPVNERAAAYARAGARMISVLCDQPFFDGSYEHLALARAACDVPLLCKDFIIDEVQLDWAKAYGASAVLLIVRCLDESTLVRLHAAAVDRGLLPLVEIANVEEARLVNQRDFPLIGVNSRDLDTLQMDTEGARKVLEMLGDHPARVHLSGLKTTEDVSRVAHTAVDAALIGEVLMRQDDPEPLLRALVAAGRALPSAGN